MAYRQLADKLRVWFMPTGWRPADVVNRFPVPKIEDVYDFEKYRTEASPFLIGWSWFQFATTALLLFFMLFRFSEIGFPGLLIYGLFIFVGIYGYSSLMDQARSAVWIEIARGAAGALFIASAGGWFGIETLIPGGDVMVSAYFVATAIGGAFCVWYDMPNTTPTPLAAD